MQTTAYRRCHRERGFTLVELAIVLVVVGLLAGSGIALSNALVAQEKRIETLKNMKAAKQALLNYARMRKRLPPADAGTAPYAWPTLPAAVLGSKRTDDWNRPLKYIVHPDLTDMVLACNLLSRTIDQTLSTQAGYVAGTRLTQPRVRDMDARDLFTYYATSPEPTAHTPPSFPVAVILVSGGPRDADDNDHDPGETDVRSVFDAYPGWGDNYGDSTGTFVRMAPRSDFDDLVVYIGAPLLYAWMCGN